MKRRLDDADKGLTRINTPGGDQNVNIVNESGMYDVVLRSDKPQAKEFRRWITSEVLPSIRKTGSYGVQPAQTELSRMDLIQIAMQAETERLAHTAACSLIRFTFARML